MKQEQQISDIFAGIVCCYQDIIVSQGICFIQMLMDVMVKTIQKESVPFENYI